MVRTFVFFVLWPTAALAEVSDKMPSITSLLVMGVVLGAVFFGLGIVRWWFGLLGLVVWVLSVVGSVSLWQEEAMRQALLREQGWWYFGAHAVQNVLILVGALVGIWFGRRRRAPNNAPHPTRLTPRD